MSTNKDGKQTNHAWKILPVNLASIKSETLSDAHTLTYDAANQVLICGERFAVYNINGQCVASSDGQPLPTAALPKGIYIARCATSSIKFIK